MTTRLFIVLPLAIDDAWLWAKTQDNRVTHTGRASHADDKAALTGMRTDNVVAILPGQCVRVFAHDLPPTRLSERIRAAAYSIEDRLGAPVDEQHVALGSGDDARIMVVNRLYLEAILSVLADHGLSPDHMVADFDVFAHHDTAIEAFDRIILPGPLGYALDPDWAGELPPQIRVSLWDDQMALEAIAAHCVEHTPLDLRHGVFAKRKFGGASWMPYARVATLVLILGLALLLWHGAQAYAMINAAGLARDEASALYTAALGEPAPANPARVLTQKAQAGAGASAPFLQLSQILFDAIGEVDGMAVEQVRYNRSGEPALKLRLSYPAFETASAFEAAIARHGGRLQPGGVREAGDRLQGDAVLGLKEPS